jgi:hypothetical protein
MKLGTVDIKLDRAVEYITVKSKKELSDDQIYPLYAVNKSTLDRVEVAQKFWKIIGNPDAQPNDEDFTEYLATITTYGMDTVIVPKFELPKYLKRIEKKLEKEANKSIIEDDEDDN